jgi:hypothetical protein
VISVVVLLAWVVLGPIGMPFMGCALMGAMCEGPCGASACASAAPGPLIALAPVSDGLVAPKSHLPAVALADLEPPPKSSVASA